jgi:sulfonate transport system ATP-binding protein
VVFQEHRLLPWLTVRGNVAFALADGAGDRGRALVDQHIELVGLKGFEDAYPHQLSGGMAQRAAIARALVNRPEILLLDEPFGLLDALTRIQLQQEILRIWEAERSTMVLVTHDIDEAVYLGDRVVVMSNRPGTVQKLFPVDLPRPRDRTCSDFVRIRKAVLREFFTEETSLPEYAI